MLSEDELKNIYGGFSKGIIVGIAGYVISFVIGLFDGYIRPLDC